MKNFLENTQIGKMFIDFDEFEPVADRAFYSVIFSDMQLSMTFMHVGANYFMTVSDDNRMFPVFTMAYEGEELYGLLTVHEKIINIKDAVNSPEFLESLTARNCEPVCMYFMPVPLQGLSADNIESITPNSKNPIFGIKGDREVLENYTMKRVHNINLCEHHG